MNIEAEDLIKEFEKLVEKKLARRTIDKVDDYEIISYCYDFTCKQTDFIENPYLIECRGTAFTKHRGNVRYFARPFEKFWNAYENDFTSEKVIDSLTIRSITEKLDGSIICVGRLPNGELLAKSKTTINSDQAKRATEIVNSNENYKDFCNLCIDYDYTPIFEYCSPENQVVLFYSKEELTLIGMRRMDTGKYANIHDSGVGNIPIVKEYHMRLEDIKHLQETGNNEGVVVIFSNGQRMKFKTLSYIFSHKAKNNILNKKNLAELILSEKLDDVLPLFVNNKEILDYVQNFKVIIEEMLNNLTNRVSMFLEENKLLSKKDYAIKANSEQKDISWLLINAYIGKEVGYKEYILKRELYKDVNLNIGE